MDDKKINNENITQPENLNQDDTSTPQVSNNSGVPQQGKINKIDNNTKLDNDTDSGDLNDDD